MALIAGIQHIRDGVEPQSVLPSDMAVIGIIGTAAEADAQTFPLNTAVDIRTNETTKRTALGATGTLVDALAGISAQLSGVGSARCVVVRVEEGVDAAATIANIVGSEATGTGVWAFLDAPEDLAVTPRIFIAPGFTSQQEEDTDNPGTLLANPVCTIMPTIAERLKGYFLPEGPSGTRQAAVDWFETLPRSARILHPLRQDAKVTDSEGDVVTKPLSPYIAAMYVSADAQTAGVPARSIANRGVFGLVGVTPSIPLSITDGNSQGQLDLEMSFGVVFRGDYGVDGSLTDGGFGFWGTDTLADESEWLFANVNRMRDYLELRQTRAVRKYLGKFNLTLQTVQAIINTLESDLVRLRADEYILDYRLGFDPNVNTPEELRLGNIDLQFMAEEPPVLRKITIRSRRHREALTNLVRNIAVQLGSEVAA